MTCYVAGRRHERYTVRQHPRTPHLWEVREVSRWGNIRGAWAFDTKREAAAVARKLEAAAAKHRTPL